MNIQLRDSKSLQEALRTLARSQRNLPLTARVELSKQQLHPNLLHGLVDCDREQFSVRSEILVGENRGDADATDVRNINDFLPKSGSCKAQWRIVTLKQGDSVARIPSELIFEFEDGAKLVVHTQAVADVGKLTNAIPSDQTVKFNVTNDNGRLVFVRVGAAKASSMPGLSLADLKTLAPRLGIDWDESASMETMVERIQSAIAAKEAPAKKAKANKPELETVGTS